MDKPNHSQTFINSIKSRMEENKKAFSLLMQEKLYSLIGSILRLELDSLIRMAYINSKKDESDKEVLLSQFINGNRWSYEKKLVTDRMMLNNLMCRLGLGWAEPIYDICCAFIHLSPYHDWGEIEPTNNLTIENRKTIVEHVKAHQHKDLDLNFGFYDLVSIADGIFDKLQGNLKCEIETFEKNIMEVK
jgi:hypothetical protein